MGPRKRKAETDEEFLERKTLYNDFHRAAAEDHERNGIIPLKVRKALDNARKADYNNLEWATARGTWQVLPRYGGVAERILETVRNHEAGNQRVEAVPGGIPHDRIMMPMVLLPDPAGGFAEHGNSFPVLRRITGETWQEYKRRLKANGWQVWKGEVRGTKYLKPLVIAGAFAQDVMPPVVGECIWPNGGDVEYRILTVSGRVYTAEAHHPTLAEALQPAPINRPAPVEQAPLADEVLNADALEHHVRNVWVVGEPIGPGQEIILHRGIDAPLPMYTVVLFRCGGTRNFAQVISNDAETTTYRGLTHAQVQTYLRLNPTSGR